MLQIIEYCQKWTVFDLLHTRWAFRDCVRKGAGCRVDWREAGISQVSAVLVDGCSSCGDQEEAANTKPK